MLNSNYIQSLFGIKDGRRDIHKCPACKELMDRIHDFRIQKIKGTRHLTKYAVKNRINSLESRGVTLRKAKKHLWVRFFNLSRENHQAV